MASAFPSSPYLSRLASERRACPECAGGPLSLGPTLDPLRGVERCPACGRFRLVEDPRLADPAAAARARAAARGVIIRPEFGGGARGRRA